MGILKNKRSAKGFKAPIPVPSSWATRVTTAADNIGEPLAKLNGHIHALATTPTLETTWLEQSAHLRAAGEIISSKQKAGGGSGGILNEQGLEYLRVVAAPIFIECYFLPSDITVRRLALPLIQGLMAAIGSSSVVSLVQANFLAFIGASHKQYPELATIGNYNVDRSIADVYAGQTGGQRAHAIELLASTAYGGQIVGQFTGDVLSFAAAELETAVHRIERDEGMGAAEASQVRDDCTQAVRLIFLCLSKKLGGGGGGCGSNIPLDQEVSAVVLTRIYELCWDLVGSSGSSIAVLNSRQVAAMVLVQLIEGSGQTPAERAQTMALHMLDLQQTTVPSAVSYLPNDLSEDGSSKSRRLACMDDAVAMACVARAVISVARAETALSSLDLVENSKNSPGACNTVHEAVFTHIASICGRSQLAPAVKVLVFEAMAAWLEHTASMLKQRDDSSSSDYSVVVVELGKRVLLLQRERIMGYLWSYWDDPLDAVQAKVKAIFEAFLDIGSAMTTTTTTTHAAANNNNNNNASSSSDPFIDDVLDLVLTMDWSRKVKYSLLATLCSRISLIALFRKQPDILDCCFETLAQVSMASRASTLLTALLERTASALQAEEEEGEEQEDRYMALWVPPVVAALCKDDESSRRMMAQLVLPVLLTSLPRIVAPILQALASKAQGIVDAANRQHALIIVLKAARTLDLITMDQLVSMDIGSDKNTQSSSSSLVVDMLNRAVYHPDWSVRADLLGLLCESRKMTQPLHALEYDLLIKLLRASASTPSADFRQQQHGPLTVLALRLATVAMHAERIVVTGHPPVPSQKARHRERARRDAAVAAALASGGSEEQALRALGVLPPAEMVAQARATLVSAQSAVDQWLDLAARGCLYPGAGFSKVAMGLRWLAILSAQFSPSSSLEQSSPLRVAGLGPPDFAKMLAAPGAGGKCRLAGGPVSAEEVVAVLVQVLVDDPFDINRASAFALLTAWPLSPPSDEEATRAWANRLLQRALRLVASTRAGESESGALLIRWIFRKFVVAQHMRLDLIPNDISSEDQQQLPCDAAFVGGLLELIRRAHAAAERNLLDAAQRHPLHGLLTAAQYVAEESAAAVHGQQQQQQGGWLEDLARVAMGVCNVMLGVLTSASPEGNIPASFREMEDKIDAIIQSSEITTAGGGDDDGCGDDDDDDDLLVSGDVELDGPVGPRQQVILSYCWRAIKQVSGLLAAITMRRSAVSDQITMEIGQLLHTLLTSIRHRGAFTAVHAAFTEVCGQMMRSPSAALNAAVGDWLDKCLDTSTICRVSVTRRSAGWPLCLLSVLTCDKLATQALLPRAMDRLFALASDLQITSSQQQQQEAPSSSSSVKAAAEEEDTTTDLPQVHAINMMRVLLEDHALAADIVPYIEHAYVLSLTGLRSSRWAIRNVCSLLYAALTRRVFGNNRSREDTKYDGITGRELFTRFPGLHPFLTNQLEDAVDQLAEAESLLAEEDENEEDQDRDRLLNVILQSGARFIHPALYPCLILLSRLQPSPLDAASSAASSSPPTGGSANGTASEPATTAAAVAPPMNLEEEPLTRVNERNSTVHVTSASTMLSMYSFTELVEMCVDSPVFKTREMAARAFAPLVPSDRAPAVAVSLLRGLREAVAGAQISANSCHGALCQVHELLRVHQFTTAMRQAFVSHVVPALAALWPVLIHRHSASSSSSSSHEESKSCSDAFIVSDIVRLRYLTIINEYVARGETLWLLQPSSSSQQAVAGDSTTGNDLEFVRPAKLTLSRFRISVLYGSLHPLFADGLILRRRLGDPQTPGAFGTVLELTRLLLACIDDRTTTVMKTDGSIQLLIEADSVEEEDGGGGGDHVQYNPWPVLCSILSSDTGFYEAKLAVLEWLTEHAENERMEIFGRLGVSANLLPALIAEIDSEHPVRDPVVRSASIRLLSCLCAKLEISPSSFPVDDLVSFWDRISAQLSSSPISVALALTELQATLVHMVYAQQQQQKQKQQQQQVSDDNDGAHSRLRVWANHLYEWADPERAHPYRLAVGRSLVVYSTIKRFYETTVEVDSASEEILRLCYWRVLQDDDEEIRDYVAQSISRRLGRQLGCDQACERLIADFDEPLTFPHTYVTNRLAYLLGPLHLPTDSTLDGVAVRKEAVRAMVEVAVNPSRVLFDHEPPNIYVDQSRNMELAYYSLVTIAASSSSNRLSDDKEDLGVFIEGAMHCVEALDAARMAISTIPGGSGEATMLSSLYSLIQSWILGARLAVFVATRLKGDTGDTIVARVKEVVDAWLNPKSDSVLLHPWIARALSSLDDLCICAKESDGEAISKDRAVSDLFLLTFI